MGQMLYQNLLRFNPRPCARGDDDCKTIKDLPGLVVSIHAPVRGATTSLMYNNLTKPVSIHAPVRGATIINMPGLALIMFQSTPLCEGRLESCDCTYPQDYCFNPRPCARGDVCPIICAISLNCFNPRPCARGD